MEYKRYCKTLSLKEDAQLIEDYKKVHAPGAACLKFALVMHQVSAVVCKIFSNGLSNSSFATSTVLAISFTGIFLKRR